MLACDWNGHSYSASITRAAVLKAASTSPTFLPSASRFAHRRIADVVVDRRSLLRERRLDVRPFHFELPHRLDGIPFLVGDDAEEALLPYDFGARNVLDRSFVDLDRHRARNLRTDHAAVHHAGHFDVGDEIELREDAAARHPRV